MAKLKIAIFATLGLAVLVLAVAVGTAKRTPAFSARVMEVSKLGDKHFNVRMLVSNQSGHDYLLFIPSLEIWDRAGWKACAETVAAYSQNDTVRRHGSKAQFVAFKTFQPGSRLRLIIEGQRASSRLDSLLSRFKLLLFRGDHRLPINPPNGTIMRADAVAITEEFREP